MAILVNAEKSPFFDRGRLEILRETFRSQPKVEVDTFDGLLVDYVERRNANVIMRVARGVRLRGEFQMALMNRRLSPNVETVFMMPAEQYVSARGSSGSVFSRRTGEAWSRKLW